MDLIMKKTTWKLNLIKKQLKCHNISITIKSVFEEDGRLYPQVFLDNTLYELNI